MRFLRLGLLSALSAAACGDGGGNGDGGEEGEPLTGIFILNGDVSGDTAVSGQITTAGAISVRSGGSCSNVDQEAPWELANFVAAGDPALRDIGDVGVDGFGTVVISRYVTPPFYELITEDVPYGAPGSEVTIFAGDDRFRATMALPPAPTVVTPAPGSTFTRTASLPFEIEPGDGTGEGIVVQMDFSNQARVLCFFPESTTFEVPREVLAEETFGVTGSTRVLVGRWDVGLGGTDGVDVHLVAASTTAFTLTLQ